LACVVICFLQGAFGAAVALAVVVDRPYANTGLLVDPSSPLMSLPHHCKNSSDDVSVDVDESFAGKKAG